MRLPDTYSYPPRGLSRVEAARYVGVSPSTFDKWVASRHMPRPKRIGGRVILDRFAIDAAFSDLPGEENAIDRILSRK